MSPKTCQAELSKDGTFFFFGQYMLGEILVVRFFKWNKNGLKFIEIIKIIFKNYANNNIIYIYIIIFLKVFTIYLRRDLLIRLLLEYLYFE